MKLNLRLFNQTEDGDLGGGGEAPESAVVPVAPATPPAPPALTPQDVSKAVEETMQKFQPQPKEPAAPSIADIQKQLGYYQVGEEEMNKLFNVEATPAMRAQAFAEMQNKMYAHVLKLIEHVTDGRVSQASKQFEPVLSHYQRQQQEAAVSKFYSEHPGLEPYKDVVALVAGQLPNKNPQTGKAFTEQEMVSNLISTVTSHLKRMGHEIDPKLKQANPNTETISEVPKSQTLRGSGRSQGDSKVSPSKLSKDEALWT